MTHYDEYHAARTGAALRDAQASFRLYMRGADHLDFLHRMTSNDFHNLQLGHGLEAVFIEQRARILDLATCYRGPDATALILSPASRTTIPAWLDRFIFAEALELADRTDETAMFELIGPHAPQLVTHTLNADLAKLQDHQLLDPQVPDGLWLARHSRAGAARLRTARRRKEPLAASRRRRCSSNRGGDVGNFARRTGPSPARARADPRLQPLGSRAWPRYSFR